jgi:hypothetical protein
MPELLPHPVWFIYPRPGRFRDIFERPPSGGPIDPGTRPGEFWDNSDCWIMLTYVYLSQIYTNVSLSRTLIPDAINVVQVTDLGIRAYSPKSYVVSCRSDGQRPTLCDRVIVQNPQNVVAATDHYVPHWPQPGLIPRAAGRGDRVSCVSFKGSINNLYERFRGEEFRQGLNRLGVALRIDDKPADKRQLRWHDYEEVDVVLAIRDLTAADYLIKPASKLVNAWHAGVPAILGPEPAFQALRRSDLDYIEVRTPDEAVEAVRRLAAQPELYRAMVQNGRERAREYTPQRIAARWAEVLSGPVATDFERWRGRRALRRLTGPLRWMTRSVSHLVARRTYRYSRDHGPRPLSGRTT